MEFNSGYILDGRNVKKVSREESDAWWDDPRRMIAKTDIGDYHVSTVFLTMDHGFGGDIPIVFETMIFDLEEEYQTRCATYDEAEAMHRFAVMVAEEQLVLDNDWFLVRTGNDFDIRNENVQESLKECQDEYRTRNWGVYFKNSDDAVLFRLTW